MLALAPFGAVAWSGWRQIARMQEAEEWVALTYDLQASRNLLLSLVLAIENNERSYVLTGLPEFLDESEKAVSGWPQLERRLDELTRDERQKAVLSALKPLMAERLALARRMVELHQTSGLEVAAREVAALKGKKLTDEILARFALMEARGDELLVERSAAARREAGTTVRLTLTGTALSVVLLITVFALMLREDRRRRRAEAEVERFFTLSLDMLGIAGADGYYKRLSPAFTETLGWSADEMLARPFLDFVHPDDRAATLAVVERLIAAGEKVLRFENRHAHKDGSWRLLSWRSVPQPDGLMFATARDVTGWRQAEEELKKINDELLAANASLADFKAAVDAHAIVAITDARGTITYVNDKFCAISKYAREELLGQDHRVINSGYHPKAFIRELWETIAAGRVWQGEIRNRSKDGSFYWVDTTIVPFLGEDGKPVQFIAIRADITERKQTEAALLESEERTRLATVAASIGVWDWDVKTGAVHWDERMFALYGLPPTPGWVASYQDWRAAVLPADRAEQEAILQSTVAAGGQSQREFRIVRASDQTLRVIQAAEMAVAGGDGRTARVVGINIDITQRKQAEDLIARLNVELAQRATQLEDANQELESFCYSVSHDLRAPLRHVHGYVEMLQRATDGQLSGTALRYLKTISDASEEMGQLIDDLLAFSRVGRTEMHESTVRLDEVVQGTIRGLEMATKDRNIAWQVAPLPPVVGDRALLKQVLANLVGNAVKYTRDRDPAQIEIGPAGEEDGRVVLFVRDNGAGFDMQYAHKLFGVFQRLHRAEEFEGTGIGLATVRRIVARHGGRVWAEGALNQGATFYFTLRPSRTE